VATFWVDCCRAGSSDPGGGVISAASEKEQADRKAARMRGIINLGNLSMSTLNYEE
jgi:hypothetical protein